MMIETRGLRKLFGLNNMKHAIQSIHLDGALMDKLTYAALKGVGADVSKVTVLA